MSQVRILSPRPVKKGVRAIKEQNRIFMTLHGGYDTADAQLRRAIATGMTVVHINTEFRLAWQLQQDVNTPVCSVWRRTPGWFLQQGERQ
jgi:fructose/tagatose bisphosphate aldolase